MSFFLRWVFAFVLLAATFNPTEWNYVAWVRANYDQQMPVAILIGMVLLVGYIIYLRATLRSIGMFGMLLVLALVGAVLWVAYDWGWISLENTTANTWIGLLALSLVLGTGLSWSLVRRKLTGQLDVDDVEE